MGFICRQCGLCCLSLGPYLTVIQDNKDGSYLLYHEVTGETDLVCIDPDKVHLFADHTLQEEEPEACVFLRRDPTTHSIRCIIHETRPQLCRSYDCYEILITYHNGEWAGRVKGGRALLSDDPGLRDIWNELKQSLGSISDDEWKETIRVILTQHGYRVTW